MKHLLASIACCLAVAGSAQTPYNPDSDGNNLMGAEDLMSLLSLYGGEFYPVTANTIVQEINVDLSIEGVQSYEILEETDVVVISHNTTDASWCNAHVELILPFNPSYKELTFMPQPSSNDTSCFPVYVNKHPHFYVVLEQGEETTHITTTDIWIGYVTKVFKLIRNPVSNAWLTTSGVYIDGY